MNILAYQGVLTTIGSIILAVLILLIMITIHEFGHYIAGKIFKFKINEFAIGMGPKIFSRKSKKTFEVFSIRALPLGGFCAFEGEDEDSGAVGSFNSKKPYERIIVLIMGATFNFVLGVIMFMLSIGIYGQILVNTYDIIQDENYLEYSLEENDTILEINGKNIYLSSDLVSSLNGKNKDDIVEVMVINNNQTYTRKVKLRNSVNEKSVTESFSSYTALGVATIEKVTEIATDSKLSKNCFLLAIKDSEKYEDCTRIFSKQDLINYAKNKDSGNWSFYILPENAKEENKALVEIPAFSVNTLDDSQILSALGIKNVDTYLKYRTVDTKFNFGRTLSRGFGYSISVSGTIFKTLGELLTGKLGLKAMGGPVTTIKTTTTAIKQGGFHFFLEIAGLIGVNLAVFNLLPIPALDGSRVVFCIIEWIRKKPVPRKFEAIIHGVGLIVLLGFSVLVDVLQLF